MLPEGEVSGVLMSPWASIQSRPTLLALALGKGGDARHGADGDGVVAAEHQGKVGQGHDALDLARDDRRCPRDLTEVAGPRVPDLEFLHVLDDDVAFVHHLVSQLGQPLGDAGDTYCRGTHVHTPPSGAEIHGNAQDMDDHLRRSRGAQPTRAELHPSLGIEPHPFPRQHCC